MSSNYEIYSAGILPGTNYKGTTYLLLGRDTDNKLSDLGSYRNLKIKVIMKQLPQENFLKKH